MSTNGTSATAGAAQSSCCNSVSFVEVFGIFSAAFAFLLAVYLCLRFIVMPRRRRIARVLEEAKRGLGPSAIAALPSFAYRGATADDELDSGGGGGGDKETAGPSPECVVCLSPVEEGEMVRQLPNCKHLFHVPCIDLWLSSHSTCPTCRVAAGPKKTPKQQAQAEENPPPPPPPPELALAVETAEGSASRMMLSGEWSGGGGDEGGAEDLERQ